MKIKAFLFRCVLRAGEVHFSLGKPACKYHSARAETQSHLEKKKKRTKKKKLRVKVKKQRSKPVCANHPAESALFISVNRFVRVR